VGLVVSGVAGGGSVDGVAGLKGFCGGFTVAGRARGGALCTETAFGAGVAGRGPFEAQDKQATPLRRFGVIGSELLDQRYFA
jgi:hypothetical protein